jgi:hypothetical protein
MFRAVYALTLVLLTSAGSAHAAGRSLALETPSSLWSAAWEWMTGWTRELPGLSAIWGEEGSSMDPNGGTKINSGNPIDPNSATVDEGSQMDPDGK